MRIFLFCVIAVILLICVKACTESFSCGPGHCCVDSNRQTIIDQQIGGFWPSNPKNGTCVKMQQQKGQICDNTCQCGAGLKCYQTLGGTWHPALCYDAIFVNQQQQYWSDCNTGKIQGCTIPP